MSTQKDEQVARSHNGRPLVAHERSCTDNDHVAHTALGATCLVCGCCWGCGDDCCAEWFCPNEDCGCSRPMRLGDRTLPGTAADQ